MTRRLPDLRDIRTPVLLLLGAGLLINVAAFFLVNQPLGLRLRDADAEIRAQMKQLELQRARSTDLTDARDRLERHMRHMQVFFEEVLSGKADRMVSVQREIREIAERHRVDPQAIGYSHALAQEGTDFVRFSAAFPLQANYEALRAFIRDIEHSRNFLIIDSIDLTNSKEGGVMLALSIRVSTVFRDPDFVLLRQEGKG